MPLPSPASARLELRLLGHMRRKSTNRKPVPEPSARSAQAMPSSRYSKGHPRPRAGIGALRQQKAGARGASNVAALKAADRQKASSRGHPLCALAMAGLTRSSTTGASNRQQYRRSRSAPSYHSKNAVRFPMTAAREWATSHPDRTCKRLRPTWIRNPPHEGYSEAQICRGARGGGSIRENNKAVSCA